MAETPRKNTRSASTTYEWRRVKVRGGAPEGPSRSGLPKRFQGLVRRDSKTALTLTVTYRGGAESWWLVQARGRKAAFPGHRCLDDVMAEINRTWELGRE